MASKEQFLKALEKPYDRILFARDVLKPVFGSSFNLESDLRPTREEPNKTEKQSIKSVGYYGTIQLDDGRKVTCYEVVLRPSVRIEQSKVTIQQYVRKLLTAGQAALVNFVAPGDKTLWRFTLVAKDSEITEDGIQEKLTHAKRYTYLVEANRPNRTLAERLEKLGSTGEQNLDALTEAFSVEKLSDAFFDEYKEHYQNFTEYLTGKRMVKEKGKWIEMKTGEPKAFLKSVFNGNEKAARDFCKKLMGRLVFLYFVQRKRWLGATNQQYKDGDLDFIFNLFQASGGDDSFYPNWLSPLFFDTLNNNQRINEEYKLPDGTIVHIPFLNGGLFDKDKVDGKRLIFSAHLFHNSKNPDSPKERGFLDFLNAFNFTVYEDSPDDHTVAVDPEMLGHIFENLLEENKEKGAFYTPKEIVHYMCRESLIEYLTTHLEKEYTVYKEVGDHQVQLFGNNGKTGQLKMMEKLGDEALNKADVERIVKEKDIAGLTSKQILRIDSLLDSVKICDPAIGSGAFPMGLLQEIFSIKEIIAYELELEWKPADVKENIIQRSIYGVDIERGAVDIARLRFWLSLLVDSEDPKPLPNLEYKIVVGNSLISMFEEEPLEIDWEIKKGSQSNMFGHDELLKRQGLLKQITETQKAYFHADAQKKRDLAQQIRNQKIDLLMNQLSLMIQTKGEENKPAGSGKKVKERMERWLDTQNWKRMIRMLKNLREHPEKPFNHFDWKLDFPEVLNEQVSNETGFDVVIGNPPYVQMQKDGGRLAEELEEKNYQTFERTGDIYALFYEKGFELLKMNGVHTFITSSQWLKASYGFSLRQYLLFQNPLKLILLGPGVFESATVDTNILIAQRGDYHKELEGAKVHEISQLKTNLSEQLVPMSYITASDWAILNPVKQKLDEKINSVGTPLEDWDLEIYRGVLTGYNKAFIIDQKKRDELISKDSKSVDVIKPVIRGRDVQRFKLGDIQSYLINIHNGVKDESIDRIEVEDYPVIKKYLDDFGKKLSDRYDQGDTKYNLRNCAYLNEFKKEKVIWKRIGSSLRFSYSSEEIFGLDSTCIATGEKIKYLTALLNSKLCQYQLFEKSPRTGMGDLIISVQALHPLQVYYPSDKEEQTIVNLVNQILDNKENGEDSTELENQIDLMVYHFYGLTYEEVKVVDDEFEVSREEYEMAG
ncbi:MAG: Eco57I restriction-modification methylase domain-containing protein [Balneolales bacterium]